MRQLFTCGALLCAAQLALSRRRAEGYYPFPLKWDDNQFGTATDVSFLNHKPAGAHGRVIVKDGRFRTSGNNEPIRFLGIGIGGDGVFELDRDAAEKVAARLAKNGVNIVRFHNLDGSDRDRDTLIDFSRPGSCHFNPEHLDRLDYFIAQLKKQGIYLVMGLKVNRTLLPADGAPPGPGSANGPTALRKPGSIPRNNGRAGSSRMSTPTPAPHWPTIRPWSASNSTTKARCFSKT